MTPGQIADEAAAAFVHVVGVRQTEVALGTLSYGAGGPAWQGVSSQLLPDCGGRQQAGLVAAKLRALVGACVLAAVERALAEAPVPGGLSGERLAEMRRDDAQFGRDPPGLPILRDRRDLLAHVEHLTRALHDCGADGSARQWAAGYEAGRGSAVEMIESFVARLPSGDPVAAAVALRLGRVSAELMGLGAGG